MNFSKTLVAAGVLLAAVASVRAADPTFRLLTGGAKQGGTANMTVFVTPNGNTIAGGVIKLVGDTTKQGLPTSVTPGAGWTIDAVNTDTTAGTISIAMHTPTGQTTAGPIVTIPITQNSATGSTLSIDPSTNFSDDTGDNVWFPFTTLTPTSILAGPVRQLGAAITGSPSVGPGGVVAVVAGGKLMLLNGTDLADAAGFTADTLTAPLSNKSRPSFGTVGGANVIAVGTNDGKVSVFNAASGAAVGAPVSVGTANASAAAIDNLTGNIYAAAENASGGATLAQINGATVTPVTLNGTNITGSPAFISGGVAVSTSSALESYRVAGTVLTPQATVASPTDTAPVLRADGTAMVTGGTTVYQVNLVAGTVAGSVAGATGAGPFSEGWYDSATDTWYYGGKDGKVYGFTAGATGPVAGTSTVASTSALQQPLVINGKTEVADIAGNFKSGSAAAVNVGGPATPAIAATGRTGTDSVIVAETGGGVAALPL